MVAVFNNSKFMQPGRHYRFAKRVHRLAHLLVLSLLTQWSISACGQQKPIKTGRLVSPKFLEEEAKKAKEEEIKKKQEEADQAEGAELALATQVREILSSNCLVCHGEKQSSQGGLTGIDQLEKLIASGFVVPGQPAESLLLRRMKQNMPPPPAPLVDKAKLDLIEKWISEGAKISEGPASAARGKITLETDIVAAVEADFEKLTPAQRREVRYFTLWPIWNMNVSDETVTDVSQGISKFVNSVSQSPKLVTLQPVDSRKTLFRLFLSDVGWTSEVWQLATEKETYFKNHPALANIRSLVGDAVPVARADDFIAANSVAPQYYQLQGLKLSLTDFLTQDLGRSSLQSIYSDVVTKSADLRRLGFNNSQVADFSRVIERHSASGTLPFWLSHEFGTANIDQDPFQRPFGPAQFQAALLSSDSGLPADSQVSETNPLVKLGGDIRTALILSGKDRRPVTQEGQEGDTTNSAGFRAEGHEIIFQKANGMLGFYVSRSNGERLDTAPTGVRDQASSGASIAVGSGCMSCHYDGVIEKSDEISKTFDVTTLSASLKTLFSKIYSGDMKSIFESDRAMFQQSLQKIGVDSTRRDPVHRVRTSYNRSATREELATLLEVSDDKLNATIETFPQPVRSAWTALLVANGQIARATLTDHLATALTTLSGSDSSDTETVPPTNESDPNSPQSDKTDPNSENLQIAAACSALRKQMSEAQVRRTLPACAQLK